MASLKQLAHDIFHETLAGVDIRRTFAEKLRFAGSHLSVGDLSIDLSAYRSIRAVAMGKAASVMAQALRERLPSDMALRGVLAAPHDALAEVDGFRSIGNHGK